MGYLKQLVIASTKGELQVSCRKQEGESPTEAAPPPWEGGESQPCEMMITPSLKAASFLFLAGPEAPLCDSLGSRRGALVSPCPQEATI